jgi:protein Tex
MTKMCARIAPQPKDAGMRNYSQKIAQSLNLAPQQVAAAIELLDAGNTLPFIARYRKEFTGSLDEAELRQIGETLEKLRTLDERRDTILRSIEEQGKLSPELRDQIETAETMTALEDLYLPYKPKRRTRAQIARERGLEPLAVMIIQQRRAQGSAHELAAPFVQGEVNSPEEALAGACDIVAETISDDAGIRGEVREKALRYGVLISRKIEDAADEKGLYANYYEFNSVVNRLKPYQVLAINRAENEKILRVGLDVAERDWRQPIEYRYRVDRRSPFAEALEQVIATNLRGLLNQPPLAGHTVLGIDPGLRTGCKLAVVDPTGKILDTGVVYLHQRSEALRTLGLLIARHNITLIAIGNGTASRETEQLCAELTRQMGQVRYLIVNEAGASVYSASELARAEMPTLDVTLRGAVSIARRAQDPLAELVKIDPKSIGVGLYQHDVDQKSLTHALEGVVESVVNQVGVELNTASPALLTHVAGIGRKLAENIVTYRESNGQFPNRKALRKVPGLGPKAFEQAAGFLRVRDSSNPFDATAIHPESYDTAEQVLSKANLTSKMLLQDAQAQRETAINQRVRPYLRAIADELQVGEPTLIDILDQLVRPGRDPRADLPAPILRSDVLSMDDLKIGMLLNGTVRNVVDFGAFVDIGVKQDGLLHNSQMPRGTRLGVGDVIEVQIVSIDLQKGRIGLALNA